MNPMKSGFQKFGSLVLVLFLFCLSGFVSAPARALSISQVFGSRVLGDSAENEEEDDEDEDEDDEDEDEDDSAVFSAGSSSSTKTVTTYVTRYETRQVSKTVLVTPVEYQTDTDGDGLVDAIDPDPKRHQKEYFTDTDGDSVADAFDLHHDDDDLTYVEGSADRNGNGIIDSYEGV